jgi:hypothetical protein
LELIPTNRDSNTKKYKEMNKVASLQYDGSSVPTAFVTKGRQRVKQYEDNYTIYLENNSTFEIELFNPTVNKVMAKIDLNGISIGPGIVLRPGERIFLERYLSEAKKFLFKTYEVDGDNEDVQRAIANNGDVDIKFYCETPPPIPYVSPTIWTTTYWPPYQYQPYVCDHYNSTSSISFASVNFSENVEYASGQQMDVAAPAAPLKSIETGRIERGSDSYQSFGYDYSSFNTFWSWKTEWKILPLSQKLLVQEDLKVYCSSCGRRQRKSEIYCPKCGKKF